MSVHQLDHLPTCDYCRVMDGAVIERRLYCADLHEGCVAEYAAEHFPEDCDEDAPDLERDLSKAEYLEDR